MTNISVDLLAAVRHRHIAYVKAILFTNLAIDCSTGLRWLHLCTRQLHLPRLTATEMHQMSLALRIIHES